MSFKSAAQRGAFFEKQKKQNGGFSPNGPNLPSISPGLPQNPMNKLSGIKPLAPIQPAKPLGSFEKLKRSIKMPKIGY